MTAQSTPATGTATGTPAAEVPIDADLVRALLRQQHPDLADLSVRPVDAGWDNAMFRLGDALAVRLPRRAVAAGLIEREQRWLPALAARLSPAPAHPRPRTHRRPRRRLSVAVERGPVAARRRR